MFKKIFWWPGRGLAGAFKEKKRHYRSVRSKTPGGPAVVLISLAFWFLVLAGLLAAADKSGLLKGVLDAGMEAAHSAGGAASAPQPLDAGGAAPVPPAPQSAPAPPAPGANPPAATARPAERWLVILHTIPKAARDEAERRQSQYRSQGLTVEIMDTDAFPRLLGGNWIIAQGPFDNRDEALSAANTARSFNSNLMVRRGL